MKTKSFIPLLGFILLMAAVSCTDPLNMNPNFDSETNKVNTQFVINIAAADEINTKQLASTVQMPGTSFRGLGSASLFTFARTPFSTYDNNMIYDVSEVSTATTPADNVGQDFIDLSSMIAKGDLVLANNATASRRILQISLPQGTNGLLLYGMASSNSHRGILTAEDENGAIAYNDELLPYLPLSSTTPMSVIGSRLVSRLGADEASVTANKNQLKQVEDMLMMIFNKMMMVGVNGSLQWDNTKLTGKQKYEDGNEYDFGGYTPSGGSPLAAKQLHWSDYQEANNTGTSTPKSPLPVVINGASSSSLNASPVEVILGNTYKAIVTFGTNEIRAGSGNAIMRQLQDIYTVFGDACSSRPINTEEMVAQKIMIQVMKYIQKFTTDATLTTNETGLVTAYSIPHTWTSLSDIHTLIAAWDLGTYNYPTEPSTDHSLNNFPFSFNLPQGSVVLRETTAEEKSATGGNFFQYYMDDIDIGGMGNPGLSMKIDQYTYPMVLTYYGNSPVRVNNNSTVTDSDYSNGFLNWVKDSNWPSWENTHVISSTRGVAMTYNIQYGVATLETKVQYSSNVKTTGEMYDNNKGIHPDEDPHVVEIDSDDDFWLTGILVGGQPNTVGWNYLSRSNSDDQYIMMVYDRALTEEDEDHKICYTRVPISGGTSDANYTLLYDNFVAPGENEAAKDCQNTVYVALEFVNKTGKDFWGLGNMIRNEGTFYLIGELSPYETVTSGTGDEATPTTQLKSISWPDEATTKQIVPPYKKEGGKITGQKITRVFIQDFTTKATFTLNQNSLKHAYVTVPDLKASKVSLGLSVDLNWQEGLVFTDVPLGGEPEPTSGN